MSLLEQQVAQIRREMELLKKNQVVIYDTAPKEPTKQSIWREGSTVKWWDGKEWKAQSSGGITDFSTSVVFSSSSRLNVTWSAGAMNIGTATGLGTFAIWSGSFTMSSNTFLYWAPDNPNSIQTTSNAQDAITSGGIILAVAIPNSDVAATSAAIKTFWNSQNDLITADQIVANSITSNKLAAALVYAGSLTLATNGIIKWGQTAFNTGTWFFLGYSSGAYKFSIGDSANKYFTYDGSDIVINGGTIRTGISGQRVEISGSNMRAYNSSNQLRLQSNASWFRFTDSAGSYNTDIEWGNYSILPALKVAGAVRADAIAWNLGVLNVFLHQWQLSFRDVSNSMSGTVLSSTNDDTLVVQGTTITLNGKNLYSNGTDLFWNGVKIN